MYKRILSSKLKETFSKFPAISVTGPRQSGKTTLVRETFPDLDYVNLEDPSLRLTVKEDPKGFLDRYTNGLIIDEAQNLPELFSYLQIYIDERNKPSQYIITGSQQFLMNERISQSLAGRVAIFRLLPLSYQEIKDSNIDTDEYIFRGFYPKLYNFDINPSDFYSSYVSTYVERDVRTIAQVTDLGLFQKFLMLCAGRAGQELNVVSIANDCGIDRRTAQKWLSVLEASYIIHFLKPYYANLNKQIIKSPKLYFYDTGLLSYLLRITSKEQIATHYAMGALFENLVVNEYKKNFFNNNIHVNLYYIRNKNGQEIDLMIDGAIQDLIEIKASKTFNPNFVNNIEYWKPYFDKPSSYVIYNGENTSFKNSFVLNWKDIIYSKDTKSS